MAGYRAGRPGGVGEGRGDLPRSRIVTEATPHDLTEEDPTPYAPDDAYGSGLVRAKKRQPEPKTGTQTSRQ